MLRVSANWIVLSCDRRMLLGLEIALGMGGDVIGRLRDFPRQQDIIWNSAAKMDATSGVGR